MADEPGLMNSTLIIYSKSEHFHFCIIHFQVFSTYSNEEYDRRNEDVDPMAASAEYELEKRVERLDLFPVELEKGNRKMCLEMNFPFQNLQKWDAV